MAEQRRVKIKLMYRTKTGKRSEVETNKDVWMTPSEALETMREWVERSSLYLETLKEQSNG